MSTLVIKNLSVVNALCFEEFSIDLEENAVTQIIGENGVGKSSIPTLLEEALYNKNSRGLAKGELVNRYTGIKGYRLIVHFMKGSDGYMVDKEVKSTTKVVLIKNGKDISGHTATQTYKLLQEIIGLDFPTFTKLIYQSMESSLDFLKATDANRKKFFLGLFNLSEYSEIEEKLKTAYNETKKELDTTKTKMDTVRAWIDKNRGDSEKPKELRKINPLDVNDLEDAVIDKNSKITNIALHNTAAQEELDRRKHLDRLNKLNVAPCSDNSEKLSKTTREYTELKGQLRDISTELRIKKIETTKLESIETVCPTCGSDLEVEDMTQLILDAKQFEFELDTQIQCLSGELDRLEYEYKQEQLEQKSFRAYSTHQKNLEQAESAIDISKPTQISDVRALHDELKALKLEVMMRKEDYDNEVKSNQLAEVYNAKLEQKAIQMAEYVVELDIHSSKLTQISEVESDLKILKESFSGKGLVNFKIESLIKSFEAEINSNLIKLTDGQFALGFIIEDSKLKLVTYSHGVEVSIKSLSTGEFNKVNMASLLAVRDMMAKLSDVSINVLFLDEVISVLSPDSLETLINHLLKERLNTFIVSHGYAHPLAEEIHLVKTNNISKRV